MVGALLVTVVHHYLLGVPRTEQSLAVVQAVAGRDRAALMAAQLAAEVDHSPRGSVAGAELRLL